MKEFNKDIVEVYAKRIYNELLIEKRKKLEELDNNDPIGKLINKFVADYETLTKEHYGEVKGVVLSPEVDMTPKTKEARAEVEKEFKDKMDDRDRLIEEVRALEELYDLDTLGELYKQFGILDANGKIYDYKTKTETK